MDNTMVLTNIVINKLTMITTKTTFSAKWQKTFKYYFTRSYENPPHPNPTRFIPLKIIYFILFNEDTWIKQNEHLSIDKNKM